MNKNEKKTFYVMMENIEDVHMTKDVGIIPKTLNDLGIYDSGIIAYGKNKEDYSYYDTNVNFGFKKRHKYTKNNILDGAIWLMNHSKEIDVLNLYHYKPSTFIWIMIYSFFNKRGQIYLKLDIDPIAGMKMKMKKGSIKYLLTKRILGKCSLISCETKRFYAYAKNAWPIEVHYIPNGINECEIDTNVVKEKIILTVGRLGTKQKATEILIQAFKRSLYNISCDWKLVLIGNMEHQFESYYNENVINDPEICNRIQWLGVINDRNILNDMYKKAAILTMPSRWEGFGLVPLEGLAKGDYLLTTELVSFVEQGGVEYGEYFEIDNIEEYSQKIVDLCNRFDSDGYLLDPSALKEYMLKNFSYEKICRQISDYLN